MLLKTSKCLPGDYFFYFSEFLALTGTDPSDKATAINNYALAMQSTISNQ